MTLKRVAPLALAVVAAACLEREDPAGPGTGLLYAVVLEPDAINLPVNGSQTLKVAAFDAANTPLDISTSTVEYASTDTSRAKVTQAGVVTGSAVGTSRIVARVQFNGVTRADTVSVNVAAGGARAAAGLALAPKPFAVATQCQRTLTPTTTDAAGAAITGLSAPFYISRDAQVATVSAAGVITGIAQGSTTVVGTITSGGSTRTDSVAVNVGASGAQAVAVAATGFTPPAVTVVLGCPIAITNGAGKTVNLRYVGTAAAPTFTPAATPAAAPAFSVASAAVLTIRPATGVGAYQFQTDSLGTATSRPTLTITTTQPQ